MKRKFKNRKKRISCNSKIKHKTFQNAIVACKKLAKERNLIARPYKCRRCGFYHIGKPSFYDDPEAFWNNIFKQMNEEEIKILEKKNDN